MNNLEKLGLKKKIASETVLTTCSERNKPHNAVVGVKKKSKDKIELKIYKDTTTYENILRSEEGTVNIISDAKVLLKYGLSDYLSEKSSPKFSESETINSPYIEDSEASIEFVVDESEKKTIEDEIGKSQLANIIGSVKKIHIKKEIEPHPLKRTDLYLIEAAILGTRIREAEKKGNKRMAKEYLEELDSLKTRCEKIGPESRELRLISEIRKNSLSHQSEDN